jgi:sugar phosphate isomerase/epimerase
LVVALNGISTMLCPFLMDVRIARDTGYDGLIVVGTKLRRFVSEGFSPGDAAAALDGLPALGLSSIRDVERSSPAERDQLLAAAEDTCRLAQAIGCPAVQVLTGPLDPSSGYQEPLRRERLALIESAARNLRAIGELGSGHGVSFYLEALVWTPLGTLDAAVEIVHRAAQSNVGLALDFWHLWNGGATPAQVARVDGAMIRRVDVADSLGPAGSRADANQGGRRVWTGAGEIPLQEWVDAVRATGFDGVWSSELLSPRHWELDPWKTAADLRSQMLDLLA